jgi:murein L,D-transpeptidase YafK
MRRRRVAETSRHSADVMREIATGVAMAVLLCAVASASWAEKADRVVVRKSESRLYLERDGKAFASFKAAFGAEPKGHKRREGDGRTPEGRYVLDSKNANSAYYRAIHISYPNAQDIAAAKAKGVDPGGLIMVHGQKNGFGWLAPVAQWFDWTDGCVAVSNKDMDTIWKAVDVGTPIEIRP